MAEEKKEVSRETGSALSKRICFRKDFGRSTTEEIPLFHGGTVCKLIEDPNGKPFSELMDELIHSMDPMDHGVLLMDYPLYVEINSEGDKDTYEDFISGLEELDLASKEARMAVVGDDPKLQMMEQAKRPNIFATLRHPAVSKQFISIFTATNLDFKTVTEEELQKNFFKAAQAISSEFPKTIIISDEIGDTLKDEKDQGQLRHLLLSQAIHLKNVFSLNPQNPIIRKI